MNSRMSGLQHIEVLPYSFQYASPRDLKVGHRTSIKNFAYASNTVVDADVYYRVTLRV